MYHVISYYYYIVADFVFINIPFYVLDMWILKGTLLYNDFLLLYMWLTLQRMH